MKKNGRRRSRLAVKTVLVFFGLAVAVIMAATLIGAIILSGVDRETQIKAMYLAGVIELAAMLILFIFAANRLIVRRITALSRAVSETAKGNYGLTVPEKGRDEIAELYKNFNKMSAELQANAFLSKDFARYVSHEFKTPLSVIKSYAENVELTCADDEIREEMGIIIAETERLAQMSATIMEICKLDSTTVVKREDEFSPASQIRSIILACQIKWTAKNIDIEPDLEEFEVKSNSSLLYHVWKNLIDNAVKFTGENGKIAVSLKRQDGKMVFNITDDGCGIAEEDKDKIFNMFFTGDKSRNKEGSGLGLPLVKNIVEKMGGKIYFESKRGEGASFTAEIPL